MCGIFGAIKTKNVSETIVSGLDALSYRGYDSAGIAVVGEHGLSIRRAEGNITKLMTKLGDAPVQGNIGIGHTRWATHGLPNENNAHPHATKTVAVVHNGIIENYQELREELETEGYHFQSDTDSESIALLITRCVDQGVSKSKAIFDVVKQLKGSFGFVALFHDDLDQLYVAKQGSPLVLGKDIDGFYISSDENALKGKASEICHLNDGEVAFVERESFTIWNSLGVVVKRPMDSLTTTDSHSGKNGYPHYMLKEIYEQPSVVRKTIAEYLQVDMDDEHKTEVLSDLEKIDFNSISRLSIVACGTSFYAANVAKYWIENLANIPVDIDIASEYRYRNAPTVEGAHAIFISQSGETADTKAAMEYAQSLGQKCIALVNVKNSSIAKAADFVLPTLAGTEIGVASTKAFTSQLTVLYILAVKAAQKKNLLGEEEYAEIISALNTLPSAIADVLINTEIPEKVIDVLASSHSAIYLGRGVSHPIAMEGALKIKEISYIHAEAFAAGELKHGPLALVDETMPVVLIAPTDGLFEKVVSNLREVTSRGGKVILVSDSEGIKRAKDFIFDSIEIPKTAADLSPLTTCVPLQLLAYKVAVEKGMNVDQPRNLAKSVTVE